MMGAVGRVVQAALMRVAAVQQWVAKTVQALPGWPQVEQLCGALTRPVRDLAALALARWPRLARAEWALETSRLQAMHPVLLTLVLALALKRGLNTTNLGHIGTDPIIYPLLSSISVFNPFLGAVCGATFGAGDFLQKILWNDIYGTSGRDLNYVGAMVGYVFAYTAVLVAGVWPGVLARTFQLGVRRLVHRVVARRQAASADGVRSPDRPWTVYWREGANGTREYSVARDVLPGWYPSDGPYTWADAAARMRALGVPGWDGARAAAPPVARGAAQTGGPIMDSVPLAQIGQMPYAALEIPALMAGAALGGWSVMQAAPTIVLPAFYLRPSPDVSCHLLEATAYGTDRAMLVGGIAGVAGPAVGPLLTPGGGAAPATPAGDEPIVPPWSSEPLRVWSPDATDAAGGGPGMVRFGDQWLTPQEARDRIADSVAADVRRDAASQQFHQDSIARGAQSQGQRMADEARQEADRITQRQRDEARWTGYVQHAAGAGPDAVDALSSFGPQVFRPDGSIDRDALDRLGQHLAGINRAQQAADIDTHTRMTASLDHADLLLNTARVAGQMAAGIATGGLTAGASLGAQIATQVAQGALYGGVNAVADGASVVTGVTRGAVTGAMGGLTPTGQVVADVGLAAWDARGLGTTHMATAGGWSAALTGVQRVGWAVGQAVGSRLFGSGGVRLQGPPPQGRRPGPPRRLEISRDFADQGMDPRQGRFAAERFERWVRDNVRHRPDRPRVATDKPFNPLRAPGPPQPPPPPPPPPPHGRAYNPPAPGGPPRQVLDVPSNPDLIPPERRGPRVHGADFQDIAADRVPRRDPGSYPPRTELNAPPAPVPQPPPDTPPSMGVSVPRSSTRQPAYGPTHFHPGYHQSDPRGFDGPRRGVRAPGWDPPEAKPDVPILPAPDRGPHPRGQGWDDDLGAVGRRGTPAYDLRSARPDADGRYDLTPSDVGTHARWRQPASALPADVRYVPQTAMYDCGPSVAASLHPTRSLADIERAMQQHRIGADPGPNARHLQFSGLRSTDVQTAFGSAGVRLQPLTNVTGSRLERLFQAEPNTRLVAAVNMGGAHGRPDHLVAIHGMSRDPEHGVMLHIMDPARGPLRVPARDITVSADHLFRVTDFT